MKSHRTTAKFGKQLKAETINMAKVRDEVVLQDGEVKYMHVCSGNAKLLKFHKLPMPCNFGNFHNPVRESNMV